MQIPKVIFRGFLTCCVQLACCRTTLPILKLFLKGHFSFGCWREQISLRNVFHCPGCVWEEGGSSKMVKEISTKKDFSGQNYH